MRRLAVICAALFALVAAPAQACDVDAAPGESWSSLAGKVDPGEQVCLPAGTYQWGAVNISDAGIDVIGTPSTVVRGTIQISAPDVTLANFYLVGTDGGYSGTLKPLADRFTALFMDISGPPQGIQIGGSGGRPRGTRILGSRIHHAGRDPQFDHGIYCARSDGALFVYNWLYRNASYGVQFYPDCDNSRLIGSSVVNNGGSGSGRGIVFGSEGSQLPSGNSVEWSIIASFASSDARRMVKCNSPGPDNSVTDTLIHPAIGATYTDCGGTVRFEDVTVGDPGYLDQAKDDYRLPDNGFVPGPR